MTGIFSNLFDSKKKGSGGRDVDNKSCEDGAPATIIEEVEQVSEVADISSAHDGDLMLASTESTQGAGEGGDHVYEI